MSLIQVQGAERHPSPLPSPGLTDLASNNPFRNQAALPSPQNSGFSFNTPSAAPDRPKSRNPFLDSTESPEISSLQQRSTSPAKGPGMAEQKPQLYGNAAVLFNNLSLDDKPNGTTMAPPSSTRPLRPENIPPSSNAKSGLVGHRPSRSNEEEKQRQLNGGKPIGSSQGLDIFADPPDAKQRRPRRNSDSSLVDKAGKLQDPEVERRRRDRERRHRDREARHRDGKGRIHGSSSKSKKPSQRLDIIDSLDVTSIYGTGLFHHDGPFDACNPHRNRKGSQRAPMQAFARDSANMAIGGSGPVNKNIDIAQFHGRGAEGFTDFATSGANTEQDSFEHYAGASAPMRRGPGVRPGVDRTTSFNPTALVDPVYGDETVGLGATTFLEGAPASRAAIERRESETDVNAGGGLSRTRSLAQKIRGINRGPGNLGRVASPDVYDRHRPTSPASPNEQTTLSAGGMRNIHETNPFFNDHDEAYEKKGAKIQIAEDKNRIDSSVGRERAMSSPKRAPLPGALERRVTNDGTGMADSEGKTGGGFLSRVKSLRGGRRARPERRE